MRGRSPETPHDVEAAIDTLYEIPPDDFVHARGELVRRLRERGEREAAAGVKSLRKPSPSVWAVNQLARRGLLDALLEVSAELRDAQGGASTAGPEALRELSGRRRREVASLTEQAGAILRAAGLAAARTQLDRVSNTPRRTATVATLAAFTFSPLVLSSNWKAAYRENLEETSSGRERLEIRAT